LKLEEVIKQVTRGVLERTDGYQRPWSLASIQGDFVFNHKAVISDLPAAEHSLDRQLKEALRQKEAELETLLANSSTELEEARRLREEAEAARRQSEEEAERIRLEIAEARRMKEQAEAARIAAESQLAMLSKPVHPARPPSTMQAAKEPMEVIVESRSYGPHEMVYLKADCYLMGSEVGRIGRHSDESAHQVCLNAFLIDRYEVTFEAYDEFAQVTGRDLPDDDGMGRGRRPVINVDWDDARAYAQWAGDKYGAQFRLPTEAEWEYACRSGGQDEEYCGSSDPKKVAVFWSDETSPVGSKNSNKIGLYDMSGNAWEMTCSPYKSGSSFSTAYGDYTGEETTCIEENPGTGKTLIFRGGSWESDVDEIRARTRKFNSQYTGGGGYSPPWINELGFRLVAEPN
jgi:formylglycine-generating enzyme required for sulfatase activity